jgi:V8-like Glu-specific endopeptidase
MPHTQLFSDRRLREEFLDRFNELAEAFEGEGGLESLEGGDESLTRGAAERAVDRMTEGVWGSDDDDDGGLEAIIQRFTRPVQLVQDNTFQPPADTFPESREIADRLTRARGFLEAAIPSAGRIDVANHRLRWIGTGWMVKPSVVVTNRHVAEEFARNEPSFAFRKNQLGRQIKASVDWRREYDREDQESVFRVKRVIRIEPDESFDVALLEIEQTGSEGQAQPQIIELATAEELNARGVGAWHAVVGYPAQDSRNSAADQQRIFDGIYNVKRLAPGQIAAIRPDGLLTHDATTLGGNSGSVLVDLASGKALALHFGGVEGQENFAVQAHRVKAIVDRYT